MFRIYAAIILAALLLGGCQKGEDDPLDNLNKKMHKAAKGLLENIEALLGKKKAEKIVPPVEEWEQNLKAKMTNEERLVYEAFEALDAAFSTFCAEGKPCGSREVNGYCSGIAVSKELTVNFSSGYATRASLWISSNWGYSKERNLITAEGLSIELFPGEVEISALLPEPNLYLGERGFIVNAGIGWRRTIVLGEEPKEEAFADKRPLEYMIEGTLFLPEDQSLYIKLKARAETLKDEALLSRVLCFLLSGLDENSRF